MTPPALVEEQQVTTVVEQEVTRVPLERLALEALEADGRDSTYLTGQRSWPWPQAVAVEQEALVVASTYTVRAATIRLQPTARAHLV